MTRSRRVIQDRGPDLEVLTAHIHQVKDQHKERRVKVAITQGRDLSISKYHSDDISRR